MFCMNLSKILAEKLDRMEATENVAFTSLSLGSKMVTLQVKSENVSKTGGKMKGSSLLFIPSQEQSL